MDIYEAIYGRRSVRKFIKDRQVHRDTIEKLLSAAAHAPSAGNLQPWRFIVVQDPSLKERLTIAALGQHFIADAPAVIIVCADIQVVEKGYGKRGMSLYCIQDTAAASQTLMLAAHAEGLGTCWIGAFDEPLLKDILSLPETTRPLAIIPIGYPSMMPQERRRTDISTLTQWR